MREINTFFSLKGDYFTTQISKAPSGSQACLLSRWPQPVKGEQGVESAQPQGVRVPGLSHCRRCGDRPQGKTESNAWSHPASSTLELTHGPGSEPAAGRVERGAHAFHFPSVSEERNVLYHFVTFKLLFLEPHITEQLLKGGGIVDIQIELITFSTQKIVCVTNKQQRTLG